MKSEYPSCSEECFYSSLEGSSFKRELTRDEKRIGLPLPYDPSRPVNTLLGYRHGRLELHLVPPDRRRAPPPDRFLVQLRRGPAALRAVVREKRESMREVIFLEPQLVH